MEKPMPAKYEVIIKNDKWLSNNGIKFCRDILMDNGKKEILLYLWRI